MATMTTDMSPRDAAAAALACTELARTLSLMDEFDRAVRAGPLERFVELWGLSDATAARVFGALRQSLRDKSLLEGASDDTTRGVADSVAAMFDFRRIFP